MREPQKTTALQKGNETLQNQMIVFSLFAAFTLFGVIVFILYGNNVQEQKANRLLKQQKQQKLETDEHKIKVEKALQELKSTQAQLIQSEKMANLGELTAGIAHGIQNTLNFVNNFSDVNNELLTELNEEIEKGNYEEVRAIAKDVIDNNEKINDHGKRADAIVKGCCNTVVAVVAIKDPTDINALCDEYLRLSNHGLRAKEKSLNATIKTEFDNLIRKINIIT